jgi:hypothetical protein
MCGVISSQQQKGASSRRIAMSDTTQLFILAGIWTLAAAILVYFIRNWPARIFVFALLVGVPFWELPYGYYNFHTSCDAGSRVQILESIPPQAGVCVDYPFEDAVEIVLKAGFARVEARGKLGAVREYVAVPTKEHPGGRREQVTTDYCISSVLNIREPWSILRHDHVVRRVVDDHVVARQSSFMWEGMWWQKAASPVMGRGGDCSNPMVQLFDAVKLGATQQR